MTRFESGAQGRNRTTDTRIFRILGLAAEFFYGANKKPDTMAGLSVYLF
jgi:hypothetical protein